MKILTSLFVALAAAGGAAAVDQGALLRHGSEKKRLVNEKLVAENTKLKEQLAKTIASSENTNEVIKKWPKVHDCFCVIVLIVVACSLVVVLVL